MQARSTRIAAGAAVVAVLAVAIVIGIFWSELGVSNISTAGWLALGFGAVATLALGFGLMTLMFISNREGYDDRANRDLC
jgi:TRAP-type C4-dicarboxylate transport system permease small subunit